VLFRSEKLEPVASCYADSVEYDDADDVYSDLLKEYTGPSTYAVAVEKDDASTYPSACVYKGEISERQSFGAAKPGQSAYVVKGHFQSKTTSPDNKTLVPYRKNFEFSGEKQEYAERLLNFWMEGAQRRAFVEPFKGNLKVTSVQNVNGNMYELGEIATLSADMKSLSIVGIKKYPSSKEKAKEYSLKLKCKVLSKSEKF
ncbi:MAG: hypothetical protein IOD12_01965, partial [Silvanigrellales bacterium]|nr:hypothetical protein [Silvanigrellales bacterium]